MKLAILGATGAVGREVLSVLEKKHIELSDIVLLASARSAGQEMQTPVGLRRVKEVSEDVFGGVDVAIFSAGGEQSKQWAPVAKNAGCLVIDNSSAFRYENDVPLVVPEINADAIADAPLIANPNCTTAIAAVVLWPIHQKYGIRRAIVSTYQATSGAGAAGMAELERETRRVLAGESAEHDVFVHPIAFNLIPHIDAFQENGYTKEEMKVAWEMRKIFGEPDLRVSCTAVRIPTLRAHSEAITLELGRPAVPDEVRDLLMHAGGVVVKDDPEKLSYPMPLTATGVFEVEVGRIRKSLVFEGGIDLFVSGDQLLKGAALNAVQILEYILEKQPAK